MRVLTLPAVIVGSALLAGCGAAPTSISSNDYNIRPGVLSEFGYAAGGRDMLVTVAGNPFPEMPKAEVERAVVDAMQGRAFGAATKFSAVPTAAMRPGYRVAMLFDSAPPAYPNDLCAGRTGQPQPTGGRLWLMTAFCGSDDARSWVISGIDQPTSPADPRFTSLVATNTVLLIPRRDDDFSDLYP